MAKISNPRGHKQSKHFTLMLVPYSSGKTRSLRIPHFMFHVVMISLVGTISTLTIFYLRTNHFKYMAEEISSRLQQSRTLNTKLERDKTALEQERKSLGQQLRRAAEDAENRSAEMSEAELEAFAEQLEYYEQKTEELELELEEMRRARDEIYDQLSSRDYVPELQKPDDISTEQVFADMSDSGIARPDFAASQSGVQARCAELLAYANWLGDRYDALEKEVLDEELSYDYLISDFNEIKPYLANYPTVWPVRGIVTSEVGHRQNPFGGTGAEFHSGIDIAVASGTDVAASGGGIVTFSGYTNGYGYLIVIDHGMGIESYYAHNSQLLAAEGERVSRGRTVAKSGSSGLSTGPHVHFEIRVNGDVKNPRNFVREAI